MIRWLEKDLQGSFNIGVETKEWYICQETELRVGRHWAPGAGAHRDPQETSFRAVAIQEPRIPILSELSSFLIKKKASRGRQCASSNCQIVLHYMYILRNLEELCRTFKNLREPWRGFHESCRNLSVRTCVRGNSSINIAWVCSVHWRLKHTYTI